MVKIRLNVGADPVGRYRNRGRATAPPPGEPEAGAREDRTGETDPVGRDRQCGHRQGSNDVQSPPSG